MHIQQYSREYLKICMFQLDIYGIDKYQSPGGPALGLLIIYILHM